MTTPTTPATGAITTITITMTKITIPRPRMPDDFLIRAALAGVGLMLAAGPLGAFVVWRRMAYMGDATAHAAILGVALALATDLPVAAGTAIVALAMALAVTGLSGRGRAADTALGVLAHSALAFGLVAVSFLPNVRVGPLRLSFRRCPDGECRRPRLDLGRIGAGPRADGLALERASDRDGERGTGTGGGHRPKA